MEASVNAILMVMGFVLLQNQAGPQSRPMNQSSIEYLEGYPGNEEYLLQSPTS